MDSVNTVAEVVHSVLLGDFGGKLETPQIKTKDDPVWKQVRDVGTRLWLDTGDIEEASRLWCSQFEALTTNNTLLNREVQKGIYDDLVRESALRIKRACPDIDEGRLILEISFVLNAYHGLRLVKLFDAYVSVELHTDLADDVDLSVDYGRRYYDLCPDRFYIKVPLTAAGFLAARRLARLGIPVNFTLGFSARQNYVAALLAGPSYVNVFMGRLNAFIADSSLGDGDGVGEKATLATQRELLKIRGDGRTRTLLIGASMRDGSQVKMLAGIDVYTMPPKVASQYHASPADGVFSVVDSDPDINLAEGVTVSDFGGAALWSVSDPFKDCVDELLDENIDSLAPGDIRRHFAAAGFGDLLPKWTQRDIRTVTSDGKIPVFKRWRDRLSSGRIGLDALMNISALCSFATDQAALDGRIRSLI